MTVLCLFFLSRFLQVTGEKPTDTVRLFEHGTTFEQFLGNATAQRERWLTNTSRVDLPPELVDRLKRASEGLRFLIVAEDWCPDSVNTVPYIATLARAADIDVRIVNRADGEALMKQHRTGDGRMATPTVVLLRNGRDVGAWVERPAILQQLFRSMAGDPRRAEQFAQRQSWYDSDRGRTTLGEVVTLAERSTAAR